MTGADAIAIGAVVIVAVVGAFVVLRIRAALRSVREEQQVLRQQISDVSYTLDATRDRLSVVERRLVRYKTRLDKQSARIKRVRTELSARSVELEEQLASIGDGGSDQAELRRRIAAFRDESQTRLDSQRRLNEKLRTRLDEAVSTGRHARSLAEKLGGRPIHGSLRFLSDETVEELQRAAETLGLSWATERQLRYMEHAVISLEARLRGRLAAPVEAMILRALVVMATESREPKVLEIGTLYGLSAAYFHEVVSPQKRAFHQTIVDPFMGYYEEGAPDLFTPIPISRQVAEENLARVGASRDDFEIVVGLSEDDEVQSHLRDRRFDVVVIDGDHSYDGVRRDFENYAGHIVEGGYLIVDDYRGPSWPEVTRYVDETIFVDQRFEVVTGELRTAVVRRIS